MATRGIKLTRSEIVNVNHAHLRLFRLRIEVTAVRPDDVDPYVFLYRQNAPDNDGAETATFMTVASVPDLAQYPRHAASNANQQPFFRLKHVELDFRSTRQAEDAYAIILASVSQLCEALDRADDLVVTEALWLGTAGSDSISLSEEA